MIRIMRIEGENVLTLFLKKMVRSILGDNVENTVDNSKSMREINFLKPKLDYLNDARGKLSA